MLEFVKNKEEYFEFIRNLRNNEKVQDGFIENSHITEDQQINYMKKYKTNFYVCLDDGKPIGYIRQIDGDIGVCTHPDHWGKGVGSFMINELMKLHPECFAKVKLDNIASVKAFEKVGFKKKYYLMERD